MQPLGIAGFQHKPACAIGVPNLCSDGTGVKRAYRRDIGCEEHDILHVTLAGILEKENLSQTMHIKSTTSTRLSKP